MFVIDRIFHGQYPRRIGVVLFDTFDFDIHRLDRLYGARQLFPACCSVATGLGVRVSSSQEYEGDEAERGGDFRRRCRIPGPHSSWFGWGLPASNFPRSGYRKLIR